MAIKSITSYIPLVYKLIENQLSGIYVQSKPENVYLN